jgi:hypothetical protein
MHSAAGFALEFAAHAAAPGAAKRNIRQAKCAAVLVAARYGLSMGGGMTAQNALNWIKSRVEDGGRCGRKRCRSAGRYISSAADSGNFPLGCGRIVNTRPRASFSSFNSFLAELPALADSTGVTLVDRSRLLIRRYSDPAVGVVFEPAAKYALFGQSVISLDFSGVNEFLEKAEAGARCKK